MTGRISSPYVCLSACEMLAGIELSYQWKISKVIPVFKKGGRQLVDSHRPIAVLSAPAKLFEIIIDRYLYRHCDPFIIDQQHGFSRSRLTVTNLLFLSNYVTKSLDVGGQVDVVYTDFKKDFDLVNHQILIGSYMGPLLFNIFINDISRVINHSEFLLFADDLKLFKSIGPHCNSADLQSDLDALHQIEKPILLLLPIKWNWAKFGCEFQ
ncbi:uncharacterized protein LOC143917298 [Arctopsyche grandis]|uniref:uncharacterized protein LOC143917298 n=1 Tax=Arctopsyche grandis TaxID=121162 RepID=UPI00406D99F3